MRIVHHRAHADRLASRQIIMLPGAYQRPEDFAAYGFIDALRQRELDIDFTVADLSLDLISSGGALLCIERDLIKPAHDAGQRIWLAGISIGGLLAIAHADHFPGRVDGLCLLGPYPGNRMVTNPIVAAGGIRTWRSGGIADDDVESRIWRWLQQRHSDAEAMPAVFLGYGAEDRFADSHRMMAEALPAAWTTSLPGGHDWPAWQALWACFLDRHRDDFREPR